MTSENVLLDSFLWATRGNLTSNDNEDSSEGGSSDGGASYHAPGMDNSILAPDAFSYS